MRNKLFYCLIAAVLICAVLVVGLFDRDPFSMSETAMGTVVTVKLYNGTQADAIALFDIFEAIEASSSVNRSSSDAMILNTVGETNNSYIYEQAAICTDIAKASDGAFDFTVGKLTKLWNIGFDNARVPDKKEISDALMSVGYDRVTLDGNTVRVASGQEIDFGAIGKGYACDKAKEFLENSKIKKAVISVGGSLLFHGKKSGGWTVAVRDPFSENGIFGTFVFDGGFVSTSGSYERYFEAEGKKYHHILDPATGYPAESDLVSVTVIADGGALSDALSTACFVLGFEKGEALLIRYGASGIFIHKNGEVSTCGTVDLVREQGK